MRLLNMVGYKLFKTREDGTVHIIRIIGMRKPFKITSKTADPEEMTIYDYELDDGSIKTIKYPIPFYANNNEELQKIIKDYIGQGLQEMRVTTVSETTWEIVE